MILATRGLGSPTVTGAVREFDWDICRRHVGGFKDNRPRRGKRKKEWGQRKKETNPCPM